MKCKLYHKTCCNSSLKQQRDVATNTVMINSYQFIIDSQPTENVSFHIYQQYQMLAVGLLLVSAIFQGRQLKVKDFSNTFIQRVHLLSSTFSMWSSLVFSQRTSCSGRKWTWTNVTQSSSSIIICQWLNKNLPQQPSTTSDVVTRTTKPVMTSTPWQRAAAAVTDT